MWKLALLVCCCLVLGSSVGASKCLQCGKNEVSKCVHSCPPEKTCRNRFLAVKCAKPTKPCTQKCVCAEGYYRNAIGECISLCECEQCKKPNEFFSCNSACDNECDKIATQNRTNCPIINVTCNKKCYCDDGYARDSNNNCVPVSECPKCLQCGVNEVSRCVHSCPPEKTCRNRFLAVRCAQPTKPCTQKCVCAEGYYRNAIGECISLCECEQCKKPNEFFSCNSACDNECDKIATQNRTNCPIINVTCNKKCYCDDGYARDSNDDCVPVSECPDDGC